MPNHPQQPVVEVNGIERFLSNKIIEFLYDQGKIDLNQLALTDFPDEDWSQLAQLLGYSVYGYHELSYVERLRRKRESQNGGEHAH